MLIIAVEKNEEIIIKKGNDEIKFAILAIKKGCSFKVGIKAPEHVVVVREEYLKKQTQKIEKFIQKKEIQEHLKNRPILTLKKKPV